MIFLENIIQVKDLSFKYYKDLFNHLNFEIKKNSFVTVLGKNGCGKSTLAHLLCGSFPFLGQIIINGIEMNSKNIKKIQKDIYFISEKTQEHSLNDTPYQEIIYYLKKQKKSEEEIKNRLSFIERTLKIKKIINCSFSTLSDSERQIVSFIPIILKKPKIIILDNATSMLTNSQKNRIFKFLKQLKQSTIVNLTNDVEESIFGDRIILLDNKGIVLNQTTKKALQNEKAFRECNLDLPFMASLSLKLKYYDLLDSTILDVNKMVDKLWN